MFVKKPLMIRIIDKKNGWMSAIYQFFKELFKNLAALLDKGGSRRRGDAMAETFTVHNLMLIY
jgi:hypothetical protein